MNILILDDDPQRHKVFDKIFDGHNKNHVFTAQCAINCLKKERFDLVCLDHDLGEFDNDKLIEDPGTGMDVAEFINLHMSHDKLPTQVLIHSWNGPAAKRMGEEMSTVGVAHVVTPFKATWETIQDIGK